MMQIGVVFPQTEIGAAVADVRRYATAGRGARVRPPAGVRPRARRRPRGARAVARPVRRAHDVPRAVRAVRLPRRVHAARAGDRGDHPAAAPDGARRQAGRRGRPADRGTVPPRRRARLERRRVRGARRSRSATAGVGCPSRSRCCAGCSARPSVTHDGDFDRITAAGLAPLPHAAADPDLDRRRSRRRPTGASAGSPTAGSPQVHAGAGARRGQGDRRRGGDRGRARPGDAGHGGPGALDRRRRRASSSTTSAAGATPARPTCRQHDERRARPGRRTPRGARRSRRGARARGDRTRERIGPPTGGCQRRPQSAYGRG